jgi:hypothetical protein
MKFCISIFALPHEIDDLDLTLTQLGKAFEYVDESNYILDVTLGVSNDLVMWEQSKLPLSYFQDKFNIMLNKCWWIKNKHFRLSENEVQGCVSKRRQTWLDHQDVDYHIWLDTDIIFDERTLTYLENVAGQLDDKHAIITPEIVKVWDNTWDCLVNKNFLDKPNDYQKTNNPYKDSGIKGDISVETVVCNAPGQPTMKFAGGWFTCISKNILDKVTVPKSFGHYGLEDTFIMNSLELLKLGTQYKIKNLVVCENYKYRNNLHLTNYLASISRKDEFLKVAQNNFRTEIEKVVQNTTF